MLRVIAITALLIGVAPGVARGASWHRPVSGRIVGTFSFDPADPYAAGQRRGIVIAARPGAPVAAACGGRVVFAGEVADSGPTLSVQCGDLRATYQGIEAVAVTRGEVVLPGEPLASVGPTGDLHLGARTGTHAYLDPATLLADPAPPLGPAPRGPRAPAERRTPTPPSPPRPAPTPSARPAREPAPAPEDAPLLAWLGLALVAAALPTGGLVQRARRRSRRTVPATSARHAPAPRTAPT